MGPTGKIKTRLLILFHPFQAPPQNKLLHPLAGFYCLLRLWAHVPLGTRRRFLRPDGEKEEAPRWRHIVSLSAYGLRRSRYEQRAVQCARSSPRRPATTLSCHAVTRCSVVAKYIGFKFSESLFPTGRHVRKRDKLVRGFLPNLKAS